MTPVRLEPGAPQSRVKHSTTEPLRSHNEIRLKCLHCGNFKDENSKPLKFKILKFAVSLQTINNFPLFSDNMKTNWRSFNSLHISEF